MSDARPGSDASGDAESEASADAASDASGDALSEASDADGGGSCTAAGSASVVGTFLGTSFVPKDAVAFPSGAPSGFIIVTDFAGACSVAPTNNLKANSNVLAFDFLHTSIQTGTFNTSSVDAQYANYDATCGSKGESAATGTVVITQVDATSVRGTFDLTFSVDHVTGSFNAALLPQPSATDAGSICE